MIFTWCNEVDGESVVDQVTTCQVGNRTIGRLHFYRGVGYFAYFRESALNRSPFKSQEDAKNKVEKTYLAHVATSGRRGA